MTGRHTVDSITSDALDQLYGQLAQVRALHQPIADVSGTKWCQVCSQEEIQPQPVGWWVPWPCPTVQALDAPAPAPAEPVAPFVDRPFRSHRPATEK